MDEKDTQQQPQAAENPAPQSSAPNRKMLIGAFCAMGLVIIALMIALIASNVGDDGVKKDPGSSAAAAVTDADGSKSQDVSGDNGESSPESREQIDPNGGDSGAVSDADSGDDTGSSDDTSADEPDSAADSRSDSSKAASSSQSGGSSGSSQSGGDQGGNSSQSSGGSGGGSSSSEKAPTGETYLTWSGNNTWENSGVTMTGMELGLTNGTSSVISNWKLELDISGVKSCDGWNGTYTVGSGKLTITPADYNKDVQAGGVINLGANIGTAGKLNITGARLNGKSIKVINGTVAKENNQAPQQQGGNQGGNLGGNQGGSNGQGSVPTGEEVKKLIAAPANATKGDDWLHTKGNKILDSSNKQVWLTGLNWFGYNTGTNTFDGLWNSQLEPTVKAIADHGFNLIRVPISAELILEWKKGSYPKANYNNAYNPTLNAMNSQEIFDYFLRLCADNGIKVMPDIHSAETDSMGHMANLWFTAKISANEYYASLEYMAERYKNNDTIIAYDLKNEPHGKPNEGSSAAIWNNSKSANNWKYVAETAAMKILAKNPNVLIMVEGTEIYSKKKGDYSSTNDADYYFNWWGGNLRGVKDYPVDLGKYQNKLVYSPHDYGPTVYEQPWFKGNYNYDSLMQDCWKDNWLYIHTGNTAPLLIGEWGGFMREPNLKWMTCLRQLIKTYHLNHTFWCLNANSGDTGGLLLDDFTTWDETKYKFVKEVLWQENGKFVGLDHQKALGVNGIALSKAKGL